MDPTPKKKLICRPMVLIGLIRHPFSLSRNLVYSTIVVWLRPRFNFSEKFTLGYFFHSLFLFLLLSPMSHKVSGSLIFLHQHVLAANQAMSHMDGWRLTAIPSAAERRCNADRASSLSAKQNATAKLTASGHQKNCQPVSVSRMR